MGRRGRRAVSTARPMPGSSGTGVHAPSGARSASARPCAAAVAPSAPTTTSGRSDRMGTEATARDVMRQLDAASAGYTNYAMTPTAAPTAADAERLAARVVELERERKHRSEEHT